MGASLPEILQSLYRSISKQIDAHAIYYDFVQASLKFDKLYKWVCHIKENAPSDVLLTLLANKCDLIKEEGDYEDYLKAKVILNATYQPFMVMCAK